MFLPTLNHVTSFLRQFLLSFLERKRNPFSTNAICIRREHSGLQYADFHMLYVYDIRHINMQNAYQNDMQ